MGEGYSQRQENSRGGLILVKPKTDLIVKMALLGASNRRAENFSEHPILSGRIVFGNFLRNVMPFLKSCFGCLLAVLGIFML